MKLTDRPNPEYIKKNPEGYYYIPIGLVEQTLDEIDPTWTAIINSSIITDTKYDIGVSLSFKDEDGLKSTPGAHTLYVNPSDRNTNHYATCLSYAIANAAKRRGIIFGRDLNERLEIGETGLPVIQLDTSKKTDEEIQRELGEITEKVISCDNKEDALTLIENSGFRFNMRLKEIANSKPSKQ